MFLNINGIGFAIKLQSVIGGAIMIANVNIVLNSNELIKFCLKFICVILFTLLIGFPVDILYVHIHKTSFALKRVFIHGMIVWMFILIFQLIYLKIS